MQVITRLIVIAALGNKVPADDLGIFDCQPTVARPMLKRRAATDSDSAKLQLCTIGSRISKLSLALRYKMRDRDRSPHHYSALDGC